jgi:ribonuclease Z
LAGLISTYVRWEATDRIEIWGGKATLDRVHDLIYGVVLRGAAYEVDIELFEVKEGILMEDEDFQLSAFPVEHRGPDCFGYTFEQKPRRPFLNDLAEQLGIPRGPERKMLVSGQPVKLADGAIIQPDQVLGETIPGEKVCITGDVGRYLPLVEPVHDADVLVAEATYLEIEADMARKFGHLTAGQAARLAKTAGVHNLVLTHLSRRYREKDIAAEAEAIFPASIVARDFDHFLIRRGQPLKRIEVKD